jgi:uncharacterized protein with beta-barrel porin domain
MQAQVAPVIDVGVAVGTRSDTPESAVAGAVSDFCPKMAAQEQLTPGGEQLLATCTAILLADPGQSTAAYRDISARSASAETTLGVRLPASAQLQTIAKQLAALRHGAGGGTLSQAGLYRTSSDWMVAAADDGDAPQTDALPGGLLSARWGGFLSANLASAKQSETATEAGFDSDTTGIIAGADYRLQRNLVVGVATQFAGGDAKLDANAGSLDAQHNVLTAYGTYYPQQDWFVEGTLSAGRGQFDLKRNLQFTVGATTVDDTSKSTTDGNELALTVGGGYEYLFSNGIAGLLLASLNYTDVELDGYTEKSASALNLVVASQSLESLNTNIGGQLRRAYSTSWGVVLPQVSATWIHELKPDGQTISAKFVNDPFGTAFVFKTADRDSNYFSLTLGVSVVYPGGISGYAHYEKLLQLKSFEQGVVSLGGRIEF